MQKSVLAIRTLVLLFIPRSSDAIVYNLTHINRCCVLHAMNIIHSLQTGALTDAKLFGSLEAVHSIITDMTQVAATTLHTSINHFSS